MLSDHKSHAYLSGKMRNSGVDPFTPVLWPFHFIYFLSKCVFSLLVLFQQKGNSSVMHTSVVHFCVRFFSHFLGGGGDVVSL